jgi:sulfonate transport system permease protein
MTAGHEVARRSIWRRPTLPSIETALVSASLLIAWELLARTVLAGSFALAAPTDVVRHLIEQGPLFSRNVAATLETALKGFLLGNTVAIALAMLIVLLPAVERPVFSAALAVYSVPIIALAPILLVLLDRSDAMVALSSLGVIFTTLVATTFGLRSADPATLNVVHVLGGGTASKLFRVRVMAALPSLFAGLRIAAPAAVLGATVGEFMGAERGLGVLITGALASLETTRVWTVAVLATLLSGGGYAAIGWLGRRLTPWAAGMSVTQATDPTSSLQGASGARRTVRVLLALAINLAVVIGGWALFIGIAGLNPFFAKGPADVWSYLFTEPEASANRALIFGGLAVTMSNAGLGFIAGLTGGTLAAIAFVLRPSLERAVMPVAITLRSIPILATAPLIILLLGRTLTATTVIIGILSFFPTMINVMVGMRLTRVALVEVLLTLNASRWTVLWRAELPSALPAVMASARIAVPASILGAVVIEWLITGVGMGNAILSGVYNADYTVLWAVAAVLTLVSMAAYGLIALAERAVLRRFAPEQLS